MSLRLLRSPAFTEHDFQGHAAVFELRDRWDCAEHVEDLMSAVTSAIERDRTTLVFDLRRVTVLDAALAAALASVAVAADEFGWTVLLVRPAVASVWRSCEGEGLDRVPTFGSGAAALLSVAVRGLTA